MNKIAILTVIFVLLTIFCGGVFGSTVTISNMQINDGDTYTTTISVDVNFTITPTDANICITLEDTNANCSWNLGITDLPYSIDLNGTNGTNVIYAYGRDINDYTSSSDTIILDNIAPTTTITGVVNGTYYGTNDFTIVIGSSATSATDLNYLWFTYNSITYYKTDSNTLTLTDLNDGTYTILVDANDDLGNSPDANTITFYVDTVTPDLNSVSVTTDWTNDEAPSITLTKTETNPKYAYLSCSASGPWYQTTYASTITDFNVNSTSYGCPGTDGNRPIFVKISDQTDKNSNTLETSVQLDKTAPSPPTGFSATANDGEVYLSWTAPSTGDNNSGNSHYRIHVLQGTTTKTDTTAGSGDTSKTISSLTNGTTYKFRVSMVDNAGNESSYLEEEETPATPSTTTTTTTTITSEANVKRSNEIVEYVKNGNVLTATCTYSGEVDNARIYYRYYNPDETQQTLEGPTNDVTSLSETHTVNGTNEKIGFWCYGTYEDTSTTSTIKYVYLDDTNPTIDWKTLPDSYAGKVTLVVTANDNKSLSMVEFDFNGVKYSTTKSGNDYSLELDTVPFKNGQYSLKAIATDKAGNIKEISKTVELINTTTPQQEKEVAIKDALSKKNVVEDLIKYLEGQGVLISQEIKTKKTIADGLVEDANALTEIEAIKAKANEAIIIYNEINSSLPTGVEVISTRDYEYSNEDIVATLIALGIDQASAEQAKAIIELTNAKRSIEILKVGDSYQARIKITFTNDTNDTIVKIVEIVPKEFAESASLLHSSHEFIIIEADPIIEFTIDTPIGSTVEVSYGIANLSEESANALIDNNVIANFAAPPIVTGKDATISGILGAGDNGFGLILTIIIIVIIVLVLAGAGSFVYMQYSKNSAPSFGATNKTGLSSKLKSKVKKDNGKAPSKWKYKG